MNHLQLNIFAVIAILLLFSCKKDEEPIEEPTVSVQNMLASGSSPKAITDSGVPVDSLYGKSYQGGLIFHFDPTTNYGLLASEADIPEVWANWGCSGISLTGADGSAIGTGAQNTLDILAECTTEGTPAEICSNYSSNGYSDWFLPSKDELNALYLNLKVNGFGNISNEQYWTSTEYDADNVWRQYLGIGVDGTWDGMQLYSSKELLAVQCNIRAIRSF